MFPIPPTLLEPVSAYRDLIERHAAKWENDDPLYWTENPKKRALEFACASAILSDADTAEVPSKSTYTDVEKREFQWIREFFENDSALAEACMNVCPPLERTIHPVYINASICRSKQSAEWRVTSDRGIDSALPAGIHGRQMVLAWRRAVCIGTRRLRDASKSDKQAFAWAMHDALLVLRPFRDGNGRTARLVLQYMRRELSLLPVMIMVEHRMLHRERAKFFNTALFVPYLQATYSISS